MDRKLIVTLLQKDIQELAMITAGFMEMSEYPSVIIRLARQKAGDIQQYISQLEEIKEFADVQERVEEKEEVCINPEETVEEKCTVEVHIEMEPEDESVVEEQLDVIEDELPIVLDVKDEPVPEEYEDELVSEKEEESENVDTQDLKEEGDIKSEYIKIDDVKEDLPSDDVVHAAEDGEKEAAELVLDSQETEEIETKEDDKENVPVELLSGSIASEIKQTIFSDNTIIVTEEKTTISQNVFKSDHTIADSLNNKKVDDIRHAISIGDRFRFQRELFNGNGELMNKTFSILNQSKSYEDALSYLHSKFKWDEEDETAESFYQIVKRKFL